MRRIFPGRLLIVTLVLGILGLLGPGAALATSATGHQDPDLLVAVSLAPDTATVGTTLTATASVTNTSSVPQTVTILSTLVYPTGKTYQTTETVNLAAGATSSKTLSYLVERSDPKGTYTLTVSATEATAAGSSSATASTTITKK